MQTIRELEAFCVWTARLLEAFTTAVLVDAYETEKDDPMGIPGFPSIPQKGQTSSGLGVRDERLHKVYEDMARELGQIYEGFKEKYTRRLWSVYDLEKRVCETCGGSFMGLEWQGECYVCRSKGE